MRKSTLLWLTLALFCGIALFLTSQKTHDRKEKLAVLETAVGKEEESIRVLQAEWGYLNQPARLEKLAAAYLHLAPLKAAQFARLEEIALRVAEEEKPEAEIKEPPPVNVIPAQAGIQSHKNKTRPVMTLDSGLRRNDNRTKTAAIPKQHAPADTRQFGDLMKSLGVD